MLALPLALLATSAFAADVDPVLAGEVQYVEYSEVHAGVALGSGSQAVDVLRATFHAAKGPEDYDALCLYVQSAAAAGSTADLALYTLDGPDRPDLLVWSGTVATDSVGLKCADFSSGVVDASYFSSVGTTTYLDLSSASKLAKAFVPHGASVNVRTIGAFSARSYGRIDLGGALPAALFSIDAASTTGAPPADLSGLGAPSSSLPAYLPFRKL